MTTMLLATDADWIRDEVDAALAGPDVELHRVRKGSDVIEACRELEPELVIIDMQIGNMGGMATTMAVRHEEAEGRLGETAVLLLADRAQDVFLARRSDVDGLLVKPLDAFRLRRAVTALLDGQMFLEGLPDEDDDDEDTGEADDAVAAQTA